MSIRYGSIESDFLKSIGFERFPSFGMDRNWHADDEIEFLDAFAARRPDRALQYCEMILSHGRRWDPTVDLQALMLYVARLRDKLARRELRVVA